MADVKYLTKEEWLIQLLQGNKGKYGKTLYTGTCHYDVKKGKFYECKAFSMDGSVIDINNLSPRMKYWLVD